MLRIFLAVCCSTMIFACSSPQTNEMSLLNSEQAHSMLQENKDLVLLDVRTPEEYASGHISGASNLNYYENFESQLSQLDKNQKYLVYCAVGGRSGQAAKLMKQKGYQVFDLEGGVKAWNSEGLPLVQ